MPITRSAKKALRQSERKKSRNLKRKREFKDLAKEAKRLVLQKKKEEARTLLPKIYKSLDKAAKAGTIKKNTAARRKSRITRLINSKQ